MSSTRPAQQCEDPTNPLPISQFPVISAFLYLELFNTNKTDIHISIMHPLLSQEYNILVDKLVMKCRIIFEALLCLTFSTNLGQLLMLMNKYVQCSLHLLCSFIKAKTQHKKCEKI